MSAALYGHFLCARTLYCHASQSSQSSEGSGLTFLFAMLGWFLCLQQMRKVKLRQCWQLFLGVQLQRTDQRFQLVLPLLFLSWYKE